MPSGREAAAAAPVTGVAAAARAAVGGAIMGVMAIVYAISFTAIIYGGELAAHLSRGIGLTLAGTSIMAVVGGFRVSYRGTVVHPQDVTALILSLAAAAIAADWTAGPDALFATVAALVAVATAVTGLAAWLFGRLRLGFVARYVPYPVLGGFLAATGYLLTVGAIGMVLRQNVSLGSAGVVLAEGNLARWLPWLATGVALAALTRRLRHGLVLPGSIALIVAAFYLGLWLTGTSVADAQARGLLLGPFPGASFVTGLGPWILAEAHWGQVALQLPALATVAGMSIIGTLLYASALEIATGTPIDPDRDLRAVGLANLGAAAAGGMVGYHAVSSTLFARALGVTGPAAGMAVTAMSLVVLFFGAGFLSVLPIGVFASIIAFLGVDLLYTWLWEERRRLPARDFAIVLLILAVAAAVGFLQAIAVGLLAAALQFIVAYSRVDVVRLRTTAAALRSRVERPEAEVEQLSKLGNAAEIYRLGGYLFFGTANRLLGEIRDRLAADDPPRFLVIDFRRVRGLDASAAFALGKLAGASHAAGVTLTLSGLSPGLAAALGRAGIDRDTPGVRLAGRLDDALQAIEATLLAGGAPVDGGGGMLEQLRRLHAGFDPAAVFERRHAAPGEEVIAEGARPDGTIVLLSGRLRAEAEGGDGHRVPLATFLPGALVGEVGHYAGVPRTARVIAEVPCDLLVIGSAALDRLAAEHPALAADFHRLAAAHLARRLMRTTALLRDADL